jgi:hypothetical protein
MDSDPVGPAARQSPSGPATNDDRDAELTRLRERLAFYQSFESLIQDNIARSGELLRQAVDMRESAATEIAAAQAEAAQQRADDRARYRILFSAMLDELTALQGQAERLARRLTSALDEIELDLPPGDTAPVLAEIDLRDDETLRRALALDSGPLDLFAAAGAVLGLDLPSRDTTAPESEADQSLAPEAAAQPDPAPPAHPGHDVDAEPAASHESELHRPPSPPAEPDPATAEAAQDDSRVDDIPDISPDVQPFAPDDIPSARQFTADNDLALQPTIVPTSITPESQAAEATSPADAGSAPPMNATIVLVHGVPRATTALSLKRYLEGLSHVGAVEPREFAEGILRLEVSGARPLAFDDLRSWSEGPSLEPVHLRDDLVEVRLSP